MQRRKFIASSAAAGLGLLIAPSCVSTSDQSKMTTGMQLYTVRDEMSKDPESTLSAIAKIGYTELENAGYNNGLYYDMPATKFKALLDDRGLSMPSGHYLTGNQDPSLIGTLNNGWERAVDDAVTMGQKYMVLAYLFDFERTSLDDYKKLVDIINAKASYAKQAGIQFCYHNHDFEFMAMDGQIPMDYILANTDSETVKMELDLYWISKVDKDPVEFFKKYENRTPLWHVKDMDNTADRDFTEVGNGTIDFERIFKNKSVSGLKHFFVEQDKCNRPPLESLKISYSNVQRMI